MASTLNLSGVVLPPEVPASSGSPGQAFYNGQLFILGDVTQSPIPAMQVVYNPDGSIANLVAATLAPSASGLLFDVSYALANPVAPAAPAPAQPAPVATAPVAAPVAVTAAPAAPAADPASAPAPAAPVADSAAPAASG